MKQTETLNQSFQDLVLQAAHDIRSPLAALAAIESRDLDLLPEDTRTLMRAAIRRLREIAESLLATQRARPAAPRRVMVGELLEQVTCEKRAILSGQLGVTLQLEPVEPTFEAWAEPVALTRALSCLVDNAIEACRGAGRVAVSVEVRAASVGVRISDNGQGMPKELVARVGRRGVTYGKAGGNGLGMAFARESAEAWGGRLEVESEWGHGTCVTLWLPHSPPFPPVAQS